MCHFSLVPARQAHNTTEWLLATTTWQAVEEFYVQLVAGCQCLSAIGLRPAGQPAAGMTSKQHTAEQQQPQQQKQKQRPVRNDERNTRITYKVRLHRGPIIALLGIFLGYAAQICVGTRTCLGSSPGVITMQACTTCQACTICTSTRAACVQNAIINTQWTATSCCCCCPAAGRVLPGWQLLRVVPWQHTQQAFSAGYPGSRHSRHRPV